MKCRRFRDLMAIHAFGTPDEEERRALERHLAICPDCRDLFEKIRQAPDSPQRKEDPPVPDWEASWRIIHRELEKRKPRPVKTIVFPPGKWRLVVPTALAGLVIGVIIGRNVSHRAADPENRNEKIVYEGRAPITEYARIVGPLLDRLLNTSLPPGREGIARPDRSLVEDVLLRTILLKQAAADRNMTDLCETLEDLQGVLTWLSNLPPDDSASTEELGRIIRRKNIYQRLQSHLIVRNRA